MAEPILTDRRIIKLEPQPTVAVRIRKPMAEVDMSALFDTHMPRLSSHAASNGLSSIGAPYARYYQFGPDNADVEIGIPVSGPSTELAPLAEVQPEEIGASELPGGLTAVVVHHGTYDTIGQVYGPFHDWIHEQGHDEGSGPWESYLDDPNEAADKTKVRTEIYWPTA